MQTILEHRQARDAYVKAQRFRELLETAADSVFRLISFGPEWPVLHATLDIEYGTACRDLAEKRRQFTRPILAEWFFDPQFDKLKHLSHTAFFALPDFAQVCMVRKVEQDGSVKETVFLMERTDWYRTLHYPDFGDALNARAMWKTSTLDPADWDPTEASSAFAMARGRNIFFFVAPLDACFTPRNERSVPSHLACYSGLQTHFSLARPSKALLGELAAVDAIVDETERDDALLKLPEVERYCFVCAGGQCKPFGDLVFYRACGHQVGCLNCAEKFFTSAFMRTSITSHLCFFCKAPFPGDCARIFRALKKGSTMVRSTESSARRKHARQSVRALGSPFYPLDLSYAEGINWSPTGVLAPFSSSGFLALKEIMARFACVEPKFTGLVMAYLLSFSGDDESEDEGQQTRDAPPTPPGSPPLTMLYSGAPLSALENMTVLPIMHAALGGLPWPPAAVNAMMEEHGDAAAEYAEIPGTPETETETEEEGGGGDAAML
jgi:hypothetical protein